MAAIKSNDKPHCYMLSKTSQGVKDVTAGLNNSDHGYNKILSLMGIERANVQVARGEFMEPSREEVTDSNNKKFQLFRDPSITVIVPESDMLPLTYEEYDFLGRHEVNPDRRYQLHIYTLENPMPTERTKPTNLKPKPESFKPVVGMTVLVPCYGSGGYSYYGKVRWIGAFEGREDLMTGVELVSKLMYNICVLESTLQSCIMYV